MNQLDQLLKNYENNLEWIKQNKSEEFVRGYLKAMKDAKWLKNKIDGKIEKEIESYFNAPDKDNYYYKKLQEIQYRRGGNNE